MDPGTLRQGEVPAIRCSDEHSHVGLGVAQGVWTKSLPVEGDVAEAVTRRARKHDLLVMGVSDSWAENQESIGDIRQELVERAATPFFLVRRHGNSPNVLRRWLARLARQSAPGVDGAAHPRQASTA